MYDEIRREIIGDAVDSDEEQEGDEDADDDEENEQGEFSFGIPYPYLLISHINFFRSRCPSYD